jgi:hypothetical protein
MIGAKVDCPLEAMVCRERALRKALPAEIKILLEPLRPEHPPCTLAEAVSRSNPSVQLAVPYTFHLWPRWRNDPAWPEPRSPEPRIWRNGCWGWRS